MKNIWVFFAIFVFSQYAFPAIVGNAKLEGIIVSYNKNTVTLSQRGKKVKVPRESIPDFFKIKGGNKVYAVIKAEKLMKKLKEEKVRQNKQRKNKNPVRKQKI